MNLSAAQFDGKNIRRVIDVVLALTDSANPRDYWLKMKRRVKSTDAVELSTVCRQLKLTATDNPSPARKPSPNKLG